MKFVKSFFKRLFNFGVYPGIPGLVQKEISLSNKISFSLLPLVWLGMVMSYVRGFNMSAIGFCSFSLFLLTVFPLNKSGKSTLSRVGLSILPQLFLLFLNVFNGTRIMDSYHISSYLFLGVTFIPLFLFQEKKEQYILITTLVFSLAALWVYDLLLVWNEKNELVIQLVINNYFSYKIPQTILWLLIVGSFLYTKNIGGNKEERPEDLIELLNEYRDKIQELKGEFARKSGELLYESGNIEETKTIINALNENYFVARYDLSGNLVSINSKVYEWLGEIRNDFFQHIKPIINHKSNFNYLTLDEHYFDHVWSRIINGKSFTVNLKFQIGDTTKFLAITFALLYDSNKKGYEILAIGQDISEIIMHIGDIDEINKAQKEKLLEVNQQIDLLNFQQMDIFEKSELLIAQKEEIKSINESLEERVKERTKVLEAQNKQLTEYAFINSHVLRSPLSTMMGLLNLISYSSLSEEDQKIYEHLKDTAQILDGIVMKINNAIENGVHFDRIDLEPERSFHALDKD